MHPKKRDCEYNVIGAGMQDLGLGTRHVQAFLLFIGLAISEASGVALSVGIVAMTDIYNTNANVEIYQWDKQIQDITLSSVLWGFTLMQLPAGQLAHAYGGKTLLVMATIVSGLASTLTPWAAHVGGWQAVCAFRVVQGLSQGAFLPALHTSLGKWAPVNERGRFGAYVYGGAQFGTMISMVSGGFLANSAMGWPAIFYTLGLVSIIYAAFLQLFLADSPAQHKSISIEEKLYIQTSLGQIETRESARVPWKAILTCMPVWAIIFTHVGFFWGYVTNLAEIPSYINKVFGADIQQNGILSAIPYLAMWIMGFVFSYVSDLLINKEIINVTTARKLANTIGTWFPALGFVILSYIPSTNLPLAVTLLVFINSSLAGTFVGFSVNMIDLAPNFAGTLMSISCFFANMIVITTPILAGYILCDDTDPSQWKIVFMIAAGILFFTNLFFIVFGSAELKPWNEPEYLRRRNADEHSVEQCENAAVGVEDDDEESP